MRAFLALFAAATLVLSLAPAPTVAQKEEKSKMTDEAERMMNATVTLKEILGIPEKGIPQSMLDNAAAIVVIPGLVKAGFIVGGKHGKGVMSVRNDTGWSHPSFVSLTGGSIGWQAGVKSTDLVLVFMSQKSVTKLLNGEFTLGADASVAAGPVGREAGAGTNLRVEAEIYSYSRSRGAFAGVSLDGSKLSIDKDANEKYYGREVKVEDLLFGGHGEVPQGAEDFKATLNRLSKKSD